MNKKEIVKNLEKIAVYMEIKGENSFKVSAYRRAAQALETDERSLDQIDDVEKMKGIGNATATVIRELQETGKSSALEQLKKEVPEGLVPLLQIQGLGGKKIAKLYQELGVTDLETLKKVCEEERVRTLEGFGKKTEDKILQAIKDAGTRPERLPVAFMLAMAEEIERQLSDIPSIERFSRAGSLRRLRETIKDLDYVIATENAEAVAQALFSLNGVSEVINKGDTKVTVEIDGDFSVQVDFRLVEPKVFATALHHFTGSKEHNVLMRQLAKEQGEKISEYGVEVEEDGKTLTFQDEKAFFNHFHLKEIPPELRQGKEELEAFQEEVPLIELEDVKADLHMHTTWSDGAFTIEEMVNAARAKGYSYMAITDHSKSLVVAKGLDEEKLRRQREEIDKLNEKYDDITIFAGVEMDILADGRLDFDDDTLENLDFVIASIHSAFSQNRGKIMKRLEAAMESPHVDLIAHPAGRIIGRRPGYDVDVERLIERAADTNTALELNANPNRLDLTAKWLRLAQKKGVVLSINTDAHYQNGLEYMKIGISAARKGWIRPESVMNTWPLARFKKFLNRNGD